MAWRTIEVGAGKADASKIRAWQVQDALDAISDAQGLVRGCLIDPVTKRRLLVCYGCGDLVWLEPEPCIVSTMCDRCSSHCARCGVPVTMTVNNVSPDFNGRPLCTCCWDSI